MKVCTKCGEAKPHDAFSPHKETRDRLRPDCKECRSAYTRSRYVPKPKRAPRTHKVCKGCKQELPVAAFQKGAWCGPCLWAKRRAQWADTDPVAREAYKARRRAEYRKYRDKHLARTKAKYQEQKNDPGFRKRLSESSRRWRQRHPDRVREKSRQDANRRNIGRDPEGVWWAENVLATDPCSYCDAPSATRDHIVPLHSGGGHEWDNLTAACGSCNSAKRHTSLLLFLLK